MGLTHVTATVRNPVHPGKMWQGLFLVDTGATDCLVPRRHVEAIGLEPEGERVCGLSTIQVTRNIPEGTEVVFEVEVPTA